MGRMDKEKMPREIWVMVCAAFAVALGYGIVAPILPQFARSFGVTITASSALISVFAGMRLAFATPAGKLVDALGERRMYMVGLLIVAVSSAACAFAPSYLALLVLRGLGGIGSVLFTISAMSLIIRLAPPRRRGRASSLYGSGFLFGNILGPALGALLAPWGMRLPFLIYAGTLVGAFLVVLFALPDPRDDEADKGGTVVEPMKVREAITSPVYRACLVTNTAHAWTNMGVRVAIIPIATGVALGYPGWLSGAALTATALGTAASLLIGGGWSDRFGRLTVVVPGLAISGTMMLVLGMLSSPALIIATCVLAGIGAGLINPGAQGALADVLDSRPAGKVVSTFQMAGDLGQILGPLAIGAVADAAGFTYAFIVAGAMCLLATLAWIPARQGAYSGYVSDDR